LLLILCYSYYFQTIEKLSIYENFEVSYRKNSIMPASKKTLRNQQQKKNQAAGLGDEKGRIPSNVKVAPTMAACTICKQSIRMVKKNAQAAAHVESKHGGKKFEECFPGFTAN
jgi:hypothetical protein